MFIRGLRTAVSGRAVPLAALPGHAAKLTMEECKRSAPIKEGRIQPPIVGIKSVVDTNKWPFCALGVWLPLCSSVMEENGEQGFSSHFARMAQTCTAKNNPVAWNALWASMSSSLHASPSRDGLFLGCIISPSNVQRALNAIAEAIFYPVVEDALSHQTESSDFERRQMIETNPELFIQELLYIQMYGGTGLGTSIFTRGDVATKLDAYKGFCEKIRRSMVFGITGGPYQDRSQLDQLLHNVVQHQDSCSSTEISTRTGRLNCGELLVEDPVFGSSLALASANRWSQKIHMLIGFPTGPASALREAAIPQALVAAMLGGGSSFSAGGPGKGLYSRLYQELLNRYSWVEDAHCLFQSHRTGGWLGIYQAVDRRWAAQALDVSIRHLANMDRGIDSECWKRAKNRLKSILLMGIESRLSHLEVLLRAEALGTDANTYLDTLLSEIDSYTMKELSEFRSQLLTQSMPTIVAAGEDLAGFPSYSDALYLLESVRNR